MRKRSNQAKTSLRSRPDSYRVVGRSNPLLITLKELISKTKYPVHLVLLICLLAGSISSIAQSDINAMEYYVDNDPGFGSATPISITTGSLVDLTNEIISAAALPSGFHTVGVRAKNVAGLWGFTEKRQFYIPPAVTNIVPVVADISAMEYYIDTDPGYGSATSIIVTTGSLVDLPNEIIAASTLPTGFHTLGVRTKNTDGVWGFAEKRQFYIPPTVTIVTPVPADIQTLEYFFDVDPGFGLATSITITTGQLIDINELIPQGLGVGHHTVHIRAKNVDGTWGLSESRPIYIPPSATTSSIADITKLEFYIDGADPGVGNGTDVPIVAGPLIDLNTVDVPTSPTLIDGQHEITFRAQNADGRWGMAETTTFDILDDCTQPVAAFTPALACASEFVTFIDNSTSLQPDATYRWYLDGDGIIDDTTVGDVTFSYPFPGTYVVALAIRQGTICLDSITTTIDIQPLPVAVFSTTGTEANQPTFFTASASNLPPAVTWDWDFDGDLVIDDNTAGNTSYIYTAEGTYNPTLTIGDGNGCGVTVTNPITIATGTTAPPFVDFLAENGCVGSTIRFIDLSQNLPTGSTYSWDFDGDGTEDASTLGSSSFAYAATGSYDAKLIINIGAGTIEAFHTIEIVDIPVANFSAVDVCEGSAMAFTDLSTNIETSAVYMWDFDNDGIIDSNTKTATAYTFSGAGPQIVSLTISNGFGCTNTAIKQVNVIQLPVPDFEWGLVCTGETVSFNNLSTGVDTGATYSWDLDGDGNEDLSTNGDVNFTFAAKGTYNASLTIANISGCSVTTTKSIEIFDRPEVNINVLARCYGQQSQMIDLSAKVSATAAYAWDFEGDGTIDDTTVGTTAFTYTSYNSYIVNLTIDNGGGCVASTDQLVVFSDAATPDFSVNKICEGEPVVFTNLSTGVNPAAIYSWDFNGDGLEDAAIPGSTDFIYPDAGLYNATLTIDNGSNCLATKIIPLDVTPPPAVDLGLDVNLCVAGTVTLDAGTGYSAYLWPDGSSIQTYTIDQLGSYMVRVQDAKGCFNTDTIAVQLLGPPVPSFEFSFDLSYQGIKVILENTSTNADTTKYAWTFGDGDASTEINPSHIYGEYSFYETSIYEVCLTAANDCETVQFCESIFVSPTQLMQEGGELVRVYPNPVSDFLQIEVDQPEQNFKSMALIDYQGKSVWYTKTAGTNFEINVSDFNRGVYLLILEQDDKFLYKKVIKNY
jgi:PKD repeat protein